MAFILFHYQLLCVYLILIMNTCYTEINVHERQYIKMVVGSNNMNLLELLLCVYLILIMDVLH